MIDTSSLFLHVLAAIGIVGGGTMQVLAGRRLRAATALPEIAIWARFTRSAGLLIASSALVSLMTGGHLAGAVWTTESRSGFSHPFITLGVIGLVLLVPVGPMIGGARLRRLVKTVEGTESGDALLSVLSQARSPGLWGPIHSLIGVSVGLVALMVYKPGWTIGTVLLLVSFTGGWIAGSITAAGAKQPVKTA